MKSQEELARLWREQRARTAQPSPLERKSVEQLKREVVRETMIMQALIERRLKSTRKPAPIRVELDRLDAESEALRDSMRIQRRRVAERQWMQGKTNGIKP